jgi:hypothetical protein
MCRWISSPPLSPTLERSKEGLYTRIGSMSMQLLGGEEPHEMLGLKPETFVPHCPPEEDERLAIESAWLAAGKSPYLSDQKVGCVATKDEII